MELANTKRDKIEMQTTKIKKKKKKKKPKEKTSSKRNQDTYFDRFYKLLGQLTYKLFMLSCMSPSYDVIVLKVSVSPTHAMGDCYLEELLFHNLVQVTVSVTCEMILKRMKCFEFWFLHFSLG